MFPRNVSLCLNHDVARAKTEVIKKKEDLKPNPEYHVTEEEHFFRKRKKADEKRKQEEEKKRKIVKG